MALLNSCGIKVEELPNLEKPYIEKVYFLKEVKFDNGKISKIFFKDKIRNPFFILIKLKNTRGKGTLKIKLYKNDKLTYEKSFFFGKEGKEYETIFLWDRVEERMKGKIFYAIFYNDSLLWEGDFYVRE